MSGSRVADHAGPRVRFVLSEVEGRVALRWLGQSQAQPDARFPRTLLRASLLHCEDPLEESWRRAAQRALDEYLETCRAGGIGPAAAYRLLCRLSRLVEREIVEAGDETAGAEFGGRLERFLLADFPALWHGGRPGSRGAAGSMEKALGRVVGLPSPGLNRCLEGPP